jgi:hypothetical protein
MAGPRVPAPDPDAADRPGLDPLDEASQQTIRAIFLHDPKIREQVTAVLAEADDSLHYGVTVE